MKSKSIFIKSLLIFLSVSFVFFGVANFFIGMGNTNILKINGKKIDINTFSRYVTNLRNQAYQSDLNENELNYYNSKEFINGALSNFVTQILFEQNIKNLGINKPKKVILEEIIDNSSFKDSNGKFSVDLYNELLSRNGLNENNYINYLELFETKNNLNQIITLHDFGSNYNIKDLLNEENKYFIVDIFTLNPENLKIDIKEPTNNKIKEYFEENEFKVLEKKIISYIDIDIEKQNPKIKITDLEDLILSSKNIDDIANFYKVKKNVIIYDENNSEFPSVLTQNFLAYDAGTFSDLIHENGNIYRIYFIEKVEPSRNLTFDEAKPLIIKSLAKKSREEKINDTVNNIIKNLNKKNKNDIISKNKIEVKKIVSIYDDDINYPDEFIESVFATKKINEFTKPILNKNSYVFALIKSKNKISKDNNKFTTKNLMADRINRSYKASLIKLFEKYLFDSGKIIVNESLLNNID